MRLSAEQDRVSDPLPPAYQRLLMDNRDLEMDVTQAAYAEQDSKNLPVFEANMTKIVYADEELAKFREIAGQSLWDASTAANSDRLYAQGVLDAIWELAEEATMRQSQRERRAGTFIDRLLLHVFPLGMQRIRHFGILANSRCAETLWQASEATRAESPRRSMGFGPSRSIRLIAGGVAPAAHSMCKFDRPRGSGGNVSRIRYEKGQRKWKSLSDWTCPWQTRWVARSAPTAGW